MGCFQALKIRPWTIRCFGSLLYLLRIQYFLSGHRLVNEIILGFWRFILFRGQFLNRILGWQNVARIQPWWSCSLYVDYLRFSRGDFRRRVKIQSQLLSSWRHSFLKLALLFWSERISTKPISSRSQWHIWLGLVMFFRRFRNLIARDPSQVYLIPLLSNLGIRTSKRPSLTVFVPYFEMPHRGSADLLRWWSGWLLGFVSKYVFIISTIDVTVIMDELIGSELVVHCIAVEIDLIILNKI